MTLQETLAKLNWGGEGYSTYQGYSYMTGPETSAWNDLGFLASTMNTWMTTQYSEMQNLLRPAANTLQQMFTNPQGFGSVAYAGMQSNIINQIGSGYASDLRALQNNMANQNMAGLTSGAYQAIQAGLAQGAQGQEAQAINQLQTQNALAKIQQQQWALGQAPQMAQALGSLPQSAQMAGSLAGMEGQQAKGFYGQQSPMSAMLGSMAGAALTIGGGLIGGPAGAMIGSAIGGGISGGLGGGGGGGFGGLAENWGSLGLPSIWGGNQNYGGWGSNTVVQNPLAMGPGGG